jgi:hypothetical protein
MTILTSVLTAVLDGLVRLPAVAPRANKQWPILSDSDGSNGMWCTRTRRGMAAGPRHRLAILSTKSYLI